MASPIYHEMENQHVVTPFFFSIDSRNIRFSLVQSKSTKYGKIFGQSIPESEKSLFSLVQLGALAVSHYETQLSLPLMAQFFYVLRYCFLLSQEGQVQKYLRGNSNFYHRFMVILPYLNLFSLLDFKKIKLVVANILFKIY